MMMLAGKVFFLLMMFIFAPSMLLGGIRGTGFSAGNVILTAIGAVGFITLQWLV